MPDSDQFSSEPLISAIMSNRQVHGLWHHPLWFPENLIRAALKGNLFWIHNLLWILEEMFFLVAMVAIYMASPTIKIFWIGG